MILSSDTKYNQINFSKNHVSGNARKIGVTFIWWFTMEAYSDIADALGSITEVPVLCLKGNHDDNSELLLTESLTPKEFHECFPSCFQNSGIVVDNNNVYGCYGYYDDKEHKTRFIYINSVDLPWIENDGVLKYKGMWHKGISQQQLIFIANALKFSEPGWGVVIVSHHSLVSIEGFDTTSDTYVTPQNGGQQLYGIIKAFKNKTSYTGSVTGDFACKVNVDYTNNESNGVYLLLIGHIPCDRYAIYDGMFFALQLLPHWETRRGVIAMVAVTYQLTEPVRSLPLML